MTRTIRAASGALAGLIQYGVTTLVGLWLTRFILSHLAAPEYGTWLVAAQALGYLSLADLGVVAILPREIAIASGRADSAAAIARALHTARYIVLRQWPAVLAVASGALILVNRWHPELTVTLAVALGAFALAFPLRVYQAVLSGTQELVKLAQYQLSGWICNAAAVTLLLSLGAGLPALGVGWAATQLVPPILAARRVRALEFPRPAAAVDRTAAAAHMRGAFWVTISQITQVLVSGLDVVIIGAVLGPAAVVPYALTGKLAQVFGALPLMALHSAGPGLSQLKGSGDRVGLSRVAAAILAVGPFTSGAVCAAIVGMNLGFVTWWVGPTFYGGLPLTLAIVSAMYVRHLSGATVFAAYALGRERLLAASGVAEGLLSATLTYVLVRQVGVIGAPLASATATLATTLPLVLPRLARDSGYPIRAAIGSFTLWSARACLAGAVGIAASSLFPAGLRGALAAAALALLSFIALSVSAMRRPPLHEYLQQLVRAVRGRLGK